MTPNQTDTAPIGSPCVMVIFGASGDLTKRKLIPALINLKQEGLLSEQFAIVGFAFDQMNTDSFRALLSEEIKKFEDHPVDEKMWQWFLERIYYIQGDFKIPKRTSVLKAR
jgi:glucose-6-phosphate 1-dehydrogenase